MGEFFLWILICCLVCYLVLLFRIFSQIYWKEHRVLQHIKFLFKSSPSWIFLIKFFFSKVVSSWCKQNLKKKEECFSIHNWSENYWFYNLLFILTLLWKWTIIVSIKSCILIEINLIIIVSGNSVGVIRKDFEYLYYTRMLMKMLKKVAAILNSV